MCPQPPAEEDPEPAGLQYRPQHPGHPGNPGLRGAVQHAFLLSQPAIHSTGRYDNDPTTSVHGNTTSNHGECSISASACVYGGHTPTTCSLGYRI